MSPLRILFCGTSAFAVPSLQLLADDSRFSIVGVITQPDRPAGRKGELMASPVKVASLKRNLEVHQPDNLNRTWESLQKNIGAFDFLVVVSYGQLLDEDVLAAAQTMPVNVHASLLPKLRGASPLQHAILEGAMHTGVTIQRMVRALDAGPILAQESVIINPRETFTSLHDKLALIGAKLLVETLSHPLKEQEQDATQATVCKKLSRRDGTVDPSTMRAEEIDRRIRALVPWPGVRLGSLKLLAAELTPHTDAFALPCKDGTQLYPTLVQPDGKKPMTGTEYERGRKE